MSNARSRWAVSAAALLLVLAACADEPVASTTTSLLNAPGSSAPVETTTSTSTTTTTSMPRPALITLPVEAQAALASDDGIFLVLPEGGPVIQLWDQPTALAFIVGEDLVVAQEAIVDSVYPRRPDGPILVFDPRGIRTLPLDGDRIRLFDAGYVDGRPVALATVGTGSGPDDTTERMLLVDLLTGAARDLGEVGHWESSVAQARLTEGRVVLESGGAEPLRVAARSLAGVEEWTFTSDPEAPAVVTVRGDELVLVGTGFVDPNFTPTITLDRYALGDGSPLGSTTLTLDPGDGVRIEGGFCFLAEWRDEVLICDQSYGGPFVIDAVEGTIDYFGDFERGVLTLVRSVPSE